MAVRDDFKVAKIRRIIFEYLVLKMLWAICEKVVFNNDRRAEEMLSYTKLSIVDYIEANTTNPEITRDTIWREFGN